MADPQPFDPDKYLAQGSAPEWAKPHELSDAQVFGADKPPFDPSQPFTVPDWAKPHELSDADVFGGNVTWDAPFDPDKYLAQRRGPVESFTRALVGGLPGGPVYEQMKGDTLGQMSRGVGQLESGSPWEMAKGAGNVALGGLGYATLPIDAPLHAMVGEPVERAVGKIPAVGPAIAPNQDRYLLSDFQYALGNLSDGFRFERCATLYRHVDVRDREFFSPHHVTFPNRTSGSTPAREIIYHFGTNRCHEF
jgi:hypothetical protein